MSLNFHFKKKKPQELKKIPKNTYKLNYVLIIGKLNLKIYKTTSNGTIGINQISKHPIVRLLIINAISDL